MGFMDKAKKMAEQSQAKLDEAQSKINTSQGGPPAGGGPVVEYDKHGRPIQPAAVTPDAGAPPVPPTATPGVPPTAPPAPPAPPASVGAPGPTPDPNAPAAPPKPPAPPAAAAAPGGPPAPEDRNRPSTEAPKLSSGDPLAG
jgi:hypothetical protein